MNALGMIELTSIPAGLLVVYWEDWPPVEK